VRGEDLREWGVSFHCPHHEGWGLFEQRAGDLVFTGSIEEARELSSTVEQDRVIRLTPQLEKDPEAWQTHLPGARTIRAGSKGDDVQFVQMALNCPTQDGTYDLSTTETVMALQSRWNMRQSGVMDEDTWKALLPTTGNYLVEFGDTSFAVRILQAALYAYDWDSDVVVTGRFDTATLRAVRALQDTYGLRLSGVMGGPEWAALLGRPVRVV
jgi:peptidoglycan hydrolase-like protein with peptidoglycan-binding domain